MQSLTTHLSNNCFEILKQEGRPNESFILQVLNIFDVEVDGGKTYKKITLSDGVHKMDFFVLPQLIPLVDTELKNGSIIKASLSFA